MDWRRVILSRCVFLVPILVGIWIAFSCFTIQRAAFFAGLAGLVFDLFGAVLAVTPDTSLMALWERKDVQERIDDLRATRTLVGQGGQIKEGRHDPEFGELLSTVQKHRTFAKTPNDFVFAGARNGTWLAASRDNKQVEVLDRESAAPAKNHVARRVDVDRWLQEEIESLKQGGKQPIRRRGLEILAIGFSFQIAGYLLRNSTWLQELVLRCFPC